jgi:hypothetical protein
MTGPAAAVGPTSASEKTAAVRRGAEQLSARREIRGPVPLAGLALGRAGHGTAARGDEEPSRSGESRRAAMVRRRVQGDVPVIRRFIDDPRLMNLTTSGVIDILRGMHPGNDKKIIYATVNPHVSSTAPISLAELEAKLGLAPSSGPATASNPTAAAVLDEIVSSPAPRAAVAAVAERPREPEPVSVPPASVATGTDKYEEVAAWVNELYDAKPKPTREDFLAAMHRRGYSDVEFNDPRFVYALQTAVGQHVSADFRRKTAITDVTGASDRVTSWPMYQRRWTLRHYTPSGAARLHGDAEDKAPEWREVRSTVSLGMAGLGNTSKEKKSGHTTDTDWNRYGNVGNTFYVLCIDGKLASDQPFLKNCKWYAEFDFASIPNLWLSSDWLDEKGIIGEAFRGSGENVKRVLIQRIGRVPSTDMFLQTLAQNYHNLEVKVPGSLAVSQWHGPVKYPFR